MGTGVRSSVQKNRNFNSSKLVKFFSDSFPFQFATERCKHKNLQNYKFTIEWRTSVVPKEHTDVSGEIVNILGGGSMDYSE